MDSIDVGLSGNDGNCSSSTAGEKKRGKRSHETNMEEPGFGGALKRVVYDPTSLHYDMSGENLMFIFNHYIFQKTAYFTAHPEQRDGTERDVVRLQNTFGKIGFTVDKPCNDFTYLEILSKLEEICKEDHKSTSSISIVILTHGNGGGIVNAADMPYPLSNVINRILHEPKLAGKPKLFFIQACRGSGTDAGHRIAIDGRSAFVIPTHSDYFVMRSSFEEHVSFRSSKGSWMIQALCDVVEEHTDQNILDVAIQVNHKVAKKISNSDQPEYNEKKQVPEVWFTLTKRLNLFNKSMDKSI